MKEFACAHCGALRSKPTGEVNRALKRGLPIHCNRICAGLAHRTDKTKAEKIEAKRIYDEEYRAKNAAILKAKKHAYFMRTYDPEKAAVERKATMARHVEYCRTPEYRAWKKDYDRRFRAREYGEFADAFLLLQDLEREIDARADWDERAYQKGTVNKTLRRKREYEQSVRHQS